MSMCISYIYSTPRRSLCVRPDAGRVWTIFPPTHWTHEYLASLRHRALASASVRLRPCFCVRASASASVRLRLHPCFCVSVRPSACPSVLLRVRPPVCVSVHAFAGRATRAVRLRVRYKNIYNYVTVHAIGKIDFEI